ncbi:Abi family protein [Fluviispira vulneris]|uniref:Abi family protein n=1 Tax=Fluviispira vulneris TaxID=2763012 RepID=UPI001647798F|nr:Abi family protein [Fluviispira vulneris]
MIITNEDFAQNTLKHINYYRLSGYWKIFEEKIDSENHKYHNNTSIERIVNLYLFDKKFRLLILEAIESFEISFRTIWAYTLAIKNNDSHAYIDTKNFEKTDKHISHLSDIMKNYSISKEDFLVHYRTNYSSPIFPPIWSICESFSFGTLVNLYSNLKINLKKDISREFHLDDEVFESCLRNINVVRNICAHHGRLWNKKLTSCRMKIPKKPEKLYDLWEKSKNEDSKIYNTILILNYFSNIIDYKSKWIYELNKFLIKSIDNKIIYVTDLKMMGIKSLSELNKL